MSVRAASATAQPADELATALSSDAAFNAWYERMLPKVYAYLANRTGDVALAEELTQLTFLAAIEQRWRYDGRAEMATWLCAIARNKLADHFRRREREERRDQRVAVREIAMTPGDDVTAVHDREAIRAALARLPAAQQAVLIFVGQDGLSVPEVARLLGRSPGATHSLLFRAREAFKEAYRREVANG